MNLPVLYSFRRCPYAIRARLALFTANISCELREILLKNKPDEMLDLSSKGTVPVLQLPDYRVLDESLEIMLWGLAQDDQEAWLTDLDDSLALIQTNDTTFKYWLDRYKYHIGYPENTQDYYRANACEFISELEVRLSKHSFLLGNAPRLADIAIFPFVRQFAFVDITWFEGSEYPQTYAWLQNWLNADLFSNCMDKFDVWKPPEEGIIFPPKPL